MGRVSFAGAHGCVQPPQEVGWALRNAACSVLRVVDVFGSRQPGEDTVSSICADHGISHGEWLSLVRVGMLLSLRRYVCG